MRAFILANIGLLPFVLFWSLVAVAPGPAIVAALALAIAVHLWRRRRREVRQMEIAGLILFAVLAVGLLAAPQFIAARALPWSFFAVALAAFVSLARNMPWTAEYAAAAFPGRAESPIFIGINKALSTLWMAIFVVLGGLAWFGAPPVVAGALTLCGAILTIFGPNWQVRWVMARKLAERREFDWPAPNFAAPRADEELDVAVIGAGVGGLSAAAMLAGTGLKVKVFEQHVLPGGYCHSWLRKARQGGEPLLFRFDAGPHDFSGAFPGGTLDRLLRRLGRADAVEWLRLDYRFVRADGETFDPPRDRRAHVEALAQLYPADSAGVIAVFQTMEALFDTISRPAEGFSSSAGECGRDDGFRVEKSAFRAMGRTPLCRSRRAPCPWRGGAGRADGDGRLCQP